MSVQAIVGGNWGDEGKGKITDFLSDQADYIVRFQGGNNAGHTIVNHYGTFKLHMLPSGVFNERAVNVLATAVAVNIEAFLQERAALMASGVPLGKIVISHRAQVVLPHHILLDKLEEKRLGKGQFGSTQTGMAPFYADKYRKVGIQIADLYHRDRLLEKVERALAHTNVLLRGLYGEKEVDAQGLVDQLYTWGAEIAPFVGDTQRILREAEKAGKHILLEGQLGALKDPDHGIYPMTTSSSPLASFGLVSTGLPATALKAVTTVVKAYSSAVGAGAFVSEIQGPLGEEIRVRGKEFGATTGRPRRIGWFDCLATRYGCELQNATEIVLTLVDVLSGFEEIKICTHYEIDGVVTRDFPATCDLDRAKPVYKTLAGWGCDITGIRHYDLLPQETKTYIKTLEDEIGVPIAYVSVGPEREATICLCRESA